MSLSRALLIGLVGTSLWLQVEMRYQDDQHLVVAAERTHRPTNDPPTLPAVAVAVVDVAPSVEALATVVRVIDGERVIAVGGQRVHDEAGALAALATTWRGSGRYADLEIETIASGATRRVIVLMH